MPLLLALVLISQAAMTPVKVSVGRNANGDRVLYDGSGLVLTAVDEWGPRIVGGWGEVVPAGIVPRDGAKAIFTATSYGPDTIEITDNMDDEYFGLAQEDSIRGFGCEVGRDATLKSLGSPSFKERNDAAERAIRNRNMKVVYWSKFAIDPEVRHQGDLIWIAMLRRL